MQKPTETDDLNPIETLNGEPVGHVTLEDVQPKEPWERQPEETGPAWNAFQVYRDMGPERSINAAGKKIKGDSGTETNKKKGNKGTLAKQYPKFYKWAMKFNWEVRALAYDKMIDRERVAQAVRDAQKMTERHIGISMLLQARGATRIKTMTPEQVAAMPIPQAIKMLNEGVEIERLSRGMATSNVSQNVSGKIEHKGDDRTLDEVRNTRDVLMHKLDELERKKASTIRLIESHKPREEAESINGSAESIRKELLPGLQSLESHRAN